MTATNTQTAALEDLLAFQHETEALAGISGRLEWDQETMMPRGAAEQRGEEMAALSSILHARILKRARKPAVSVK